MAISPHDAELRITIGEAGNEYGKLKVALQVKGDGRGHVVLYADDPSNKRRDGVFVALNLTQYNQLRALVRKTDETIKQLSETKQLQSLMLPWE